MSLSPLSAKVFSSDSSRLSTPVFTTRLVVAVLSVNLVLVVLAALSLWISHRQYQERAEVSSRNLAEELQQNIDGTLGRIDLVLLSVIDEILRQRDQGDIAPPTLDAFLVRQAARLPDMDGLRVTDAQGILHQGRALSADHPISLADRDFFAAVRDTPAADLLISKPVLGYLTHEWQVIVFRRITLADGSFGGVVNAVLTIRRFQRMFATLDLGRQGMVSLCDADMVPIASTPNPGSGNGAVALSPRVTEMRQGAPDAGTYVARATLDQVERTFSYHRIGQRPLFIIVGLATDDTFAEWRGQSAKVAVLVLAFMLVSLLATRMMVHMWKHRDQALRNAQLASTRLHAILQNTPIGLSIIGPDRIIQLANQAMSDLFSLSGDDIVGKTPAVFYGAPAQFEDLGRRAYPQIHSGETFLDEIQLRRTDGTTFWCRLRGRLLDPQQPELGSTWTLEDISERRQAEEALRASEQRFRAVFEQTFQYMGLLSPSGILLDANHAALEVIGRDMTAVRGQPYWKTPWWNHTPDLQARLHDSIAAAGQGQTSRFETLLHAADGREIIVDVSLKPLRDENGQVVLLICEGRDITELREREAEFRTTMEATTVGIFSISEVIFRYVNSSMAEMFGYTIAEMVGRMGPPDIVIAEEREEVRERTLRRAQGEPGHPYRLHFLRKDGSVFDGMVWSNSTFHHDKGITVGSLIDISDSIRAEEDLRRTSEQLEASNRELEQFAYIASHDLREPLRLVSSYVTLLERRLDGKLDGETREFISFVRDGATRMNRLILDLLEYSRIGRGQRPMTLVGLTEVLEEAALNLRPALDEAQAHLDIAPDLPTIPAERNEMVQLFQNLIGNAVKYRDAARPPHIAVRARRQEDSWVLSVQDNGIGIAAADHDRIFGIFQRLHGRSKYEGTGIGLAVCKRVVEHHKGRIWLESSPGEGSTFHVSLPAGTGRDPPEMTEAPPPRIKATASPPAPADPLCQQPDSA